MEHDLKENSDSDIFDDWIVLSPSSEGASQGNAHTETSDEDSLESFGAEKLEIPKGDEESDGISIISESDVCDNIEAIPILPQALREEINVESSEYGEKSLTGEVIPALHSSWRGGICQDSYSESDGCESTDVPQNISLCPRKFRRRRGDELSSLSELGTCDCVKCFSATQSGMPSTNVCMRIYVHHPNDHINYVLTILLALVLATVTGLGIGHFLGTKETLVTPEDTVYKLRLENQMLQKELHLLLNERDEWRRIVAKFSLSSNEKIVGLKNFVFENGIHYVWNESALFNLSLLSDKEAFCALEKNYLGEKVVFQQLDTVPSTKGELVVKNAGVKMKKHNNIEKNSADCFTSRSTIGSTTQMKDSLKKHNNIEKNAADCFTSESTLGSTSEMKDSQNTNECVVQARYEKTSKKLAGEIKSVLSHGFKLSGKLKEALSFLDGVFDNWKNLETDIAAMKVHKSNSFDKDALKKIKHILYDSDKTKKLLSKTVDKLNLVRKKFLKNYGNLEKESIFMENDQNDGPLPTMHDSHLSNKLQKSSDVVYEPALTSSHKLSLISYNILDNIENNDIEKPEESEYLPVTNKNLQPLQKQKFTTTKHPSSKLNGVLNVERLPAEHTNKPFEQLRENKRDRILAEDKNNKQWLEEKYISNKYFKKQKYVHKEPVSSKFHKNNHSDEGKRKKENYKMVKSFWKGAKGEKSENYFKDIHYGKELKSHWKDAKGEKSEKNLKPSKFTMRVKYNSRKLSENLPYAKHKKLVNNIKRTMNFVKKHQYKKENDRYGWTVDALGYKLTNVSGEWLMRRQESRATLRENHQKSDWFFDRAKSRKYKREEDLEKARWYFQRSRSRQKCRVEPNTKWCKDQESRDSFKYDRNHSWKRDHMNDCDDHDHSSHCRKDWKAQHPFKQWRGVKFFSRAFKAAVNLMKS